MNNENNLNQQTTWIKALNKQGLISCCQLLNSMRYYVKNPNMEIGREEEWWFMKFSYYFLFALQNAPMSSSETVSFCEECSSFYNKLVKSISDSRTD